MTAAPARRARALTALALACGCLLPGVAAAAPQAAARPSPPGEWWWDTNGVGEAHRTTRGEGAIVAVIDSPLHPGATELQGDNIEPVRAYCRGLEVVEAQDNSFHGTSMAAMIAGDGTGPSPDRPGMRGVAPEATVRIYATDDDRPAGQTERWDCGLPIELETETQAGAPGAISRAIRDATDEGAHIINLSLSFGRLEEAVAYAVSKGVVVVASVNTIELGITDSVGLPGTLPGVVAVQAADERGFKWSGSTTGSVYVSAPGVDVRSGKVDPDGSWNPDAVNTGTSPAAAYVSGVLALTKSRWPQATGPQLVQHLIRNTADPGATVWDAEQGFGPTSLSRLLANDATKQPDVLPFTEGPNDLVIPERRAAGLARRAPAPPSPAPSAAPSPTDPSPSPPAAASPGASGSAALPVGLGVAGLLGLGVGAVLLRRRTASSPHEGS